MFGREAIVVEDREADHDHSFSTAYDLSDAEFEVI